MFEVNKMHSNNDRPGITIEEEIKELLDVVKLYGNPSIYYQDFAMTGIIPVIKVERHPEFDWEIKLHIGEDNAFYLDLDSGTLIKTLRPSNVIGMFHYCYLVRDRQSGDALCYIGWRNESAEKFMQHSRREGIKTLIAVQSLSDIEE